MNEVSRRGFIKGLTALAGGIAAGPKLDWLRGGKELPLATDEMPVRLGISRLIIPVEHISMYCDSVEMTLEGDGFRHYWPTSRKIDIAFWYDRIILNALHEMAREEKSRIITFIPTKSRAGKAYTGNVFLSSLDTSYSSFNNGHAIECSFVTDGELEVINL